MPVSVLAVSNKEVIKNTYGGNSGTKFRTECSTTHADVPGFIISRASTRFPEVVAPFL